MAILLTAAWGVVGLLAVLLVHPTSANFRDVDWKWRKGRVTFYGTDGWSIHKGSCNYGYIWQDEPVGQHVAAVTDVAADYVDSCGLCIEAACDPSWITDNLGSWFDRTHSCRDSSASVIMRITDVCPCMYPANQYSNKRWCCGDVDHFDISIWAFEKLAETRWGVIPVRYRPVPCDYQPDKPAPGISSPTPIEQPSWGAVKPTRDWPQYEKDSARAPEQIIFDEWYPQGISDASWGSQLQSLSDSSRSGAAGSTAVCAKIPMRGAVAFRGWPGMFEQHMYLEFWVYAGTTGGIDSSVNQLPDVWVSISGPKGGCHPNRLYDLKPTYMEPRCKPYCTDYYWGYLAYLPIFNGAPFGTVINRPWDFSGCGGNSVHDLTTIEFRNDGWRDISWVCFDRIKLV